MTKRQEVKEAESFIEIMHKEFPDMKIPKIHMKMCQRIGHLCGIRHAGDFLKSLRDVERAVPIDIQPAIAWVPRSNETEPSEDVDLLFRLNMVSETFFEGPIDQYEAKWAKRLRVSLAGLNPFLRLVFVREFAKREKYQVERRLCVHASV